MTIAQAFKHKAKLLKEISRLKSRIEENNRFLKGKSPHYDARKLTMELGAKTKELTELKVKIITATLPSYPIIFEMAEQKSMISHLQNIPTSTEDRRYYHEENPPEYEVVYSTIDIDKAIEGLEKKIEAKQDELDKFNHVTNI